MMQSGWTALRRWRLMAFVLLAARRGPSEVPPETQRALGDEILAAFRQPSEEITAAAEYLRGKGHRVDITADGAEAIDIVRHELPDVVVASFWLLRRDGFDLLDTLKERVPPGRARVAWITSMTADA